MNASSPEIQWFIARDGKQYGPVSDVEMRKLVELGHMKPGDLVWRPGFTDWRPSVAVFAGPQAPATPPAAAAHPAGDPTGNAGAPSARPQPTGSMTGGMIGAQPAPGSQQQPAGPRAGGPHGPGGQAPVGNQPGAMGAAPAQRGSAPAPGGSGGAAQQWPAMGPATGRPGPGIPVSTITPSSRPGAAPGHPAQGPAGAGYAGQGRPGAPQQGFGQPGAPQPGLGQPGLGQPGMGQPGMGQPGPAPSGNPTSGRPAGATQQPAFQPHPGAGGATHPSQQAPQQAHNRQSQPGALQPMSHTSDFEDEPAPARGRRGGRLFATAVVVLSLAAVGGFVVSKGGVEPALKALGTGGQSTAKDAASAPAAATSAKQPGQVGTAAAPATPAASLASTVSDAEIAAGASTLDSRIQQAAMWTLIKKDYPDWYSARIQEAGKLVAEKKSDQVVTKYLIEQLVSLRRQNADQALGASTSKLKAIANAFLANLKSLAARSTDACYSFISQGETSGPIVELLAKQGQNLPIEAQVIAIFTAIDEGRKSRAAHSAPVKSDYDVLADQLAKIGWSQTDLQLFADPKALARSSPEKVCKMVQDWFTAHISIGDAAVQERLLVETLRPVVAG